MNKFFKLVGFDAEKKQTTLKTEIVAGIVTFLAMCYILTLSPNFILGEKHPAWSSLFIATALGAVLGTLLMAFLAKMPLAQAPGIGLTIMLMNMVCITTTEMVYGYRFTIGQAFMMVLISGVIFLLLSTLKIKGKSIREMIFDGMPKGVRTSISVGIGLFIAFIGYSNAEVNVSAMSDTAIVCVIGLLLIVILEKLNIKGAVILGIFGATLVGIPFGVTDLSVVKGDGNISWAFWKNFANFFAGENSVFFSIADVFKTGFPDGSLFTVVMIIITMCMIDMFDTMGTIVGCCAGNRVLSDENDKPYNYDKIMLSDSIATCAGALLGASSVTTFVESGAGVAAGGRTGMTAFTTACLFFLSMFILPVFAAIPSAATAAALIYVGVLMMKGNVKGIDFSDIIQATSAFLTISIMVLASSITDGIGAGVVGYTVLAIVEYFINLIKYAINKKKHEKPVWSLHVVTLVITVLFLIYFIF